ncbi:hypothetical protein GQ600_3787 [Phytophthora cactorum]|nr:hypothetical protein GQ600_3787 [Phytophthora cactorum]
MEESKVPMAFAAIGSVGAVTPGKNCPRRNAKAKIGQGDHDEAPKKRICQQKLELEYLRGLVGKLESNLAQLEASKSAGSHETEAQG